MCDALSNDTESDAPEARVLTVEFGDDTPNARLDKALAAQIGSEALSRSRLRKLIEDGEVSEVRESGARVRRDPAAKVRAGTRFEVRLPPPVTATPEPEAIPLSIVHEDAHLIVIDKPAGMVVHPAPGAWSGTLVNALLAHCGDTLSGIGGERRPGIVHRIDKDTTGLLVVAKSDTAHHGLAAQFATHEIERSYTALVWGHPSRSDPRLAGLPAVRFEPGWTRIETSIGRSRTDRKKMAVNVRDGRRAVTRFRTLEKRGPCALLECRLETGRTHQIRVHLTHLGHPLVGDQSYGRARSAPASLKEPVRQALEQFPRQALHAATLGFRHPVTGEELRFHAPLATDIRTLLGMLGTDDRTSS